MGESHEFGNEVQSSLGIFFCFYPHQYISFSALGPFLRTIHRDNWSVIRGSIRLTNVSLCQRNYPVVTGRVVVCLVCYLVSLVGSPQSQSNLVWQKGLCRWKVSRFFWVIDIPEV